MRERDHADAWYRGGTGVHFCPGTHCSPSLDETICPSSASPRPHKLFWIGNGHPYLPTCTFQADPSNYYHPLAFAYYPDSAVLDGTEVELGPTASGTASNGTAPCLANGTCPTPLYYEGDTLLGNEGNLSQSIGLETYERLFLHPVTEWNAMNFSVRLIFDDESYDKDIFYFCHVSTVPTGVEMVDDMSKGSQSSIETLTHSSFPSYIHID